jgi:hypothetical protein
MLTCSISGWVVKYWGSGPGFTNQLKTFTVDIFNNFTGTGCKNMMTDYK